MNRRHFVLGSLIALLPLVATTQAQQGTNLPAFEIATRDVKRLQLAPGLKLDVWAIEPQLSNGVAFSFRAAPATPPMATPSMECFVAESHRWAKSIFDITQHTNWLLADMSFRTVADRYAFLTNQFATNLTALTADSELVRLVADTDGDGRADRSEIFAEGFNSAVDGTAAGVLAREGEVWFADIPNLWLLGGNENGISDPNARARSSSRLPVFPSSPDPLAARGNPPSTRRALASGFGVHIGVSGHDLHGLIKGPDGRIYMSFGDRGVCLTNREGVVINLPDTGGVLRCEPDGRDLELFCFGLRNPQELAFDDFGNLWTVDNDTAGADESRVLHLVEGGDYGWRCSYQHMEGFGPWVQEELWKGGQDGILPPAGTVSQGPSGLAYYPGTGFGDRLAGKFLHCDFPGGVWAFSLKPLGASYVVDTKEKFLWNCWPTDVDFGPDGAAYVLDWVQGWGQPGKGRIYRITPNSEPGTRYAELVAQTRRLLAEGMTTRGEKELPELLGHPDRRVRLEAQWELASAPATNRDTLAKAFAAFSTVARTSRNQFARIHALWGIGQVARKTYPWGFADELAQLGDLVGDPDELVAGAAMTVLGEAKLINVQPALLSRLKSPSAFLRAKAVSANRELLMPGRLTGTEGNLRHSPDYELRLKDFWFVSVLHRPNPGIRYSVEVDSSDLMEMFQKSKGSDPFLTHEVVREVEELFRQVPAWVDNWQRSANPESRTAFLTAQRRAESPAITNFLSDPDAHLIIAAGRAIHDVPIVEGFPALASFITKVDCPTNLYSRVIDACFRLGLPQHAQMLAGFANRRDVPDWARVLALRAIADWGKPPPLDRVNGLWRPVVSLKTAEDGKTGKQEDEKTGERESKTVPSSPRPGFPSSAAVGVRPLVTLMQPPALPPDLGRSIPYAEGVAVRRNEAPAKRAFLRVAGDLLFPNTPNEAGVVLLGETPVSVQLAVIDTATKLRTREAAAPLLEKFTDTNSPPAVRRAIVPALAAINAVQAGEAVKVALADVDPGVQASAVGHLDRLDGSDATGVLVEIIGNVPGIRPGNTSAIRPANLRLPQAAFAALARSLAETRAKDARRDPTVSDTLTLALEALNDGRLDPGLELDLITAAEADFDPTVQAALTRYRAKRKDDSPESWSFALQGGDVAAGRRVFLEKPETQCSRCHAIGSTGGTLGPRLDGIGGRQTREYLLDSLLRPNATIASGYESVVFSLANGTSATGILKQESANEFVLMTPEDGEVTVKLAEIQSRSRGLSAMPDGLAGFLTKFELRDLIEYLAALK